MTISTRDQLINSLGNNTSRFILDKASIASQLAGNYCSLWRATGQPGQGAIPAATAICTNATLGGMNFNQQTSPATSYLGYAEVATGNSATTLEIHDRIAHMGGLNGTLTTAQTANVDLSTQLGSNNVAARIGDSNYSDVQWWLEWYTATGATASNATINVTYNNATTGNLTAIAVGGTVGASRMMSLNALVPTAQSGLFIRHVNTVTLSASTATAGSFGITATRIRASLGSPIANMKFIADWAQLGFPEIANNACLFPIVLCGTTSSGTVRGGGKIIHG